MSDLPEPLTPAECDLRSYTWMKIDVTRLLTSETWVLGTAEQKVACFTLWAKSWHQVPAGSLPDHDIMLAHLSEAGSGWKKVRDHALRGWIKCSDGRLYHPVVCENAKQSYEFMLKQRARTDAARAAKAAKKASAQGCDTPPAPPVVDDPTEPVTASVTEIVAEVVTGSIRQDITRYKKVREEDRSLRSLPQRAFAAEAFDGFWAAYPRKVGKDAARKAWAAALKRGADPAAIGIGLSRQRWPTDPQFIPHPATWLNGGRWQDDPGAAAPERQSTYDQQMEKMRRILGCDGENLVLQ